MSTASNHLDAFLLIVLGLGALLGALLMLVLREPMRVAVALIASMSCLGGIYGVLGVHFIAAFQVLIYVGAVMVFMVYAIMLLEVREVSAPRYSQFVGLAIGGFVLLLGLLIISFWRQLPMPAPSAQTGAFGIQAFSVTFLSDYWLHFELTSVLLLAAVAAALAVIRIGREVRRQPLAMPTLAAVTATAAGAASATTFAAMSTTSGAAPMLNADAGPEHPHG